MTLGNDLVWLMTRLRQEYPGMFNNQDVVDSSDMCEFLGEQIEQMELDLKIKVPDEWDGDPKALLPPPPLKCRYHGCIYPAMKTTSGEVVCYEHVKARAIADIREEENEKFREVLHGKDAR